VLFKVFVISAVLVMHCCLYRILKFHLITLCCVLVVYCGVPVLRMRGALANDMI